MKIGEARAIFEDIESEDYSEVKKLMAIEAVVKLETHNSFTKQSLLDALRWMLSLFVSLSGDDEDVESE